MSSYRQEMVPGFSLSEAQSELVRILSGRAPFDTLTPIQLAELAAGAELIVHDLGESILTEGGGPVTYLRVIQRGAVEIRQRGRTLDRLGPGDTFGLPAMLSGLEPGFEARVVQDTLCYRIPKEHVGALLSRRRAGGSTHHPAIAPGDPTGQPVAALIHTATVLCTPEERVGPVAARMNAANASAAIVQLADGAVGILSDRDLRARVLAAGRGPDTPVGDVMTASALTIASQRLGGEALFELLEAGVRHAPVVDPHGAILGLITAGDLFAAQPRSWFSVRRAIAHADQPNVLAAAAAQLPEVCSKLHRAGLHPYELARVYSALIDALIVRALQLAAAVDDPQDGVLWLALGVHARRELLPGSPPEGVLLCAQPPDELFLRTAAAVLRECGLPDEIVTCSPADCLATGGFDLRRESVLFDRRSIFGGPQDLLPALSGPELALRLDRLRARALVAEPPTGLSLRTVIGHDGGSPDLLDIKDTVLRPIFRIATWSGALSGDCDVPTPSRLRSGVTAGALTDAETQRLCEAYEFAMSLHADQRIAAMRRGDSGFQPLDPAALSPLARDQLRDAFDAIRAVQQRLRADEP